MDWITCAGYVKRVKEKNRRINDLHLRFLATRSFVLKANHIIRYGWG